MKQLPYILLIAPSAPPARGAESIQVQRILTELDQKARGRLVTVRPTNSGWGKADDSLHLDLKNFDRQHLALPLHPLSHRILTSRHFARLHVPDAFFWIRWFTKRIGNALPQTPDVIYSRSSPMSAALLARDLKHKLQVPWIMHLSDPWANSPYKKSTPRDVVAEASCFRSADLITLTTEGQAAHYRAKYPEAAGKIFVTPNVMANSEISNAPTPTDERLHLVFAGNLYGRRSPEPLVQALEILRATHPETLKKLHIDFYGNLQESALASIARASDVIHYHGAVSFEDAYRAQSTADVLLSIEPEAAHPLDRCFLLSKVVDGLALRKPLLAITPKGSEAEKLCREGYGWAASPSAPEAIAARLTKLVSILMQLRNTDPKAPPQRLLATTMVDTLLGHIQRLLAQGSAP